MAMRKFYNFKEKKELYIERVLFNIHYKRLGKRIKEEISNHMDDMYEDFSSTCDDEYEITRKVLEEMGDPDELGLQFKEANKRKLEEMENEYKRMVEETKKQHEKEVNESNEKYETDEKELEMKLLQIFQN